MGVVGFGDDEALVEEGLEDEGGAFGEVVDGEEPEAGGGVGE